MSRKRMVVRAFQKSYYAWPLGQRNRRTEKWLHRMRRINLHAYKAALRLTRGAL